MRAILRSAGAVLAGVVVAVALIGAAEFISGQVYPLPPDLDIQDALAMAGYIATLPSGAFLLVLLGYALGAFSGGYVAGRLAPSGPALHAGGVALVLVTGSIMNLLSFPHPGWFRVTSLLVVLVLPVFAARLLPRGT
jgi:hypothetical protein